MSGVVAVIGLLVLLFDLQRRRRSEPTPPEPKSAIHVLAGRFVEIFEAHGVARAQIPKFVGPRAGLTLADLSDAQRLVERLNDDLIDEVCERFGVRRDWLDGKSEKIYSINRFYKHPEAFREFICQINDANPGADLQGYVLRGPPSAPRDADTLLILEETIGVVGDDLIRKIHFCDTWSSTYWKSRTYLAACIAIAWDNDVYLIGKQVSDAWLQPRLHGSKFIFDEQGDGDFHVPGQLWHPEDLALDPKQFLQDIGEREGLTLGLELWLKLDSRGFMQIRRDGLSDGVRKRFEVALMRLQNK